MKRMPVAPPLINMPMRMSPVKNKEKSSSAREKPQCKAWPAQIQLLKGPHFLGGYAVLPCKAALETYFNVKLRVRSPGDEGKSLNSTFQWADLLNANMIQNIQI